MKEISKAIKLFCWVTLIGSCLMVISTIGHLAWNQKLLEMQIGVIFAFSALAFNASLLIDGIKKKECRRANDIQEEIWRGARWVGTGTLLISYSSSAYFLYQMGHARSFLDFDAGCNFALALAVLVVAWVVEKKIFPIVGNPLMNSADYGGRG